MVDIHRSETQDRALVLGWLTARSIARGLPLPLADNGGWRVDTYLPEEMRRHVFVGRTTGLVRLGHTIREPKIFLKLFGPEEKMRRLLPPRWRIQPPSFFMTLADRFEGPSELARGYEMAVSKTGDVIRAEVRSQDGAIVASGFAAETSDTFVYDRIETDISHRRRGLARSVMRALGAARRSKDARQVLVATADGKALYSTMGWVTDPPHDR